MYYDQSGALGHLQVPGFVQTPGQLSPVGQGHPDPYSAYHQPIQTSMDTPALEAMLGDGVHPHMTQDALYVGAQDQMGVSMQQQNPAIAYSDAHVLNMHMVQSSYGGQQMMIPVTSGPQLDAHGQWLMGQSDLAMDFDDAALQQAVVEAFQTNPGQYAQHLNPEPMSRSRSHNSR